MRRVHQWLVVRTGIQKGPSSTRVTHRGNACRESGLTHSQTCLLNWRLGREGPGKVRQRKLVGLEDVEALHDLVGGVELSGNKLVRSFYSRWFAIDPTVGDLFPADMSAQREHFRQALQFVLWEMASYRTEGLVNFLAQLGRDHRKFGATDSQYDTMRQALLDTTREVLQPIWDQRMEATATEVYTVMIEVMRSAAASDIGQPWWDGKVIEFHRTSRDLALIRLKLNAPMPYHCGQYVHVQVPQSPRNWRYLSLAIPPDPEGYIEFHVRAVPGGLVSGDIVNKTKVGDTWRISPPLGALSVNRDGGDILMVAGSTGIAPLRCLIMELSQWAENPRVHLFYGARYPQELYDLWTLWHIASTNPWLSVTPVTEYPRNPDWATEYNDPTPPRGLHVRQTGLLSEVVTAYGGWGDRQILIGGSASMIQATKEALVSRGADASRIQHDPL